MDMRSTIGKNDPNENESVSAMEKYGTRCAVSISCNGWSPNHRELDPEEWSSTW